MSDVAKVGADGTLWREETLAFPPECNRLEPIMKLATATLLVIMALDRAQAFCSTKPAFARTMTECSATLDGRKVDSELKPTNNMVLIKQAKEVEETGGGIILAGKAKIKKTEGTVVAVGPGKTAQDSGITFDMPISPGETVLYGMYDGTEVDIDGEKHALIRDDDVIVKFNGDLTLENAEVVWDSVMVEVETKPEEESTGGILIAKGISGESKPSVGEVIKVGPGRMATNGVRMEMDVAVGDMIKFRHYSTSEVKIEDKDYTVVRMSDILAKF